MHLSALQTADFEKKGFLRFENAVSSDDIIDIRSQLEDLLAKKAGMKEGAYFDMLAPAGQKSDEQPMQLVQIKNASHFAPALLKTQYVRNAVSMARQILGPGARLWFDMLILKPAHSDAGTPWHQDEAFCDPKFEHKEITFWMPLQDVTEENGCMSFIEGTHKGAVLQHHSPGDDPTVHALECCDEFDSSAAVACPIPVGGFSIHHARILHKAGANRSDKPRFAYILGFHVPPKPSLEERSFPWLAEKQTVDGALMKAWLLRGGIFPVLMRRLRRGELFTFDGLSYGIQRTYKLLFR